MRFNDHLRHYLMSPKGFDNVSASARLCALIDCMMALRYGPGFMTAVRNVCYEVRDLCRRSEQVERYAVKLRMLRTFAWRENVFKDLGGESAMKRWHNQPAKAICLKRKAKHLSEEERQKRDHIKLCAKTTAHPRILRDPCRLDAEGLFRLPPISRHPSTQFKHPNIITHEYNYDPRPFYKIKGFSKPIMVWPDEFQVFADYERGIEAETETERLALASPDNHIGFNIPNLNIEVFADANHKAAVFKPP